MSDESIENTSLTLFSIILTLIAVIAFVALIFWRTGIQLQTQQQVTQVVQTKRIGPLLQSQVITQEQASKQVTVGYPGPELPPDNATMSLLIPGSISAPLNLAVEFSDENGIPEAIQQQNAVFTVVAVNGTSIATNCNQNDGTHCWVSSYSGLDLSVITAASPDPNEVNGHFRVPMYLPYFAQPGIWTVYWTMTPVDGNGIAQPSLMLTNADAPLRINVGSLTAIDVTANLDYVSNGLPMRPDMDSDPTMVGVRQMGNVPLHVFVYGEQWMCSAGQRMPASSTKFSTSSTMSWTDPGARALTQGVTNKILVSGLDNADWTVPLSQGNMLGTESFIGKNSYLTMIHTQAGISGSCSSTLTNIATQVVP